MFKTRLKETVSALRLIPPEPSGSRLGKKPGPVHHHSSPGARPGSPIPGRTSNTCGACGTRPKGAISQPRAIGRMYAGAVGVILAGWLIHRLGPSGSTLTGQILMLAGAVVGAWYCLKSLRHQRHSAPRR